jgi:hypothetical protein
MTASSKTTSSTSSKRGLSKREIEETIFWLLTHRRAEVQATLRKFRKLPLAKQRQLDRKLLYLVSILDAATKAQARKRKKAIAASYDHL